MICRVHGIPWCGRSVKPGPVIAFDFESSGPTFKRNLTGICKRYEVPQPRVTAELQPYVQNDDPREPLTARLLEVLKSKNSDRLSLIAEALREKPNALVIVDPTELLFRVDTREKTHVTALFAEYRQILAKYPTTAIIGTFNMRKMDRRDPALTEPTCFLIREDGLRRSAVVWT
jgi:hypothetical protein